MLFFHRLLGALLSSGSAPVGYYKNRYQLGYLCKCRLCQFLQDRNYYIVRASPLWWSRIFPKDWLHSIRYSPVDLILIIVLLGSSSITRTVTNWAAYMIVAPIVWPAEGQFSQDTLQGRVQCKVHQGSTYNLKGHPSLSQLFIDRFYTAIAWIN